MICAPNAAQEFCEGKATALQLLEKSKAIVLEHNMGKFAATALGQIINALYGTQVLPAISHCMPALVLGAHMIY